MFHRQRKNTTSAQAKSLKDLLPMVSSAQFLSENKRQALLEKMNTYSVLEPSRYESLCSTLIDNLVSYCQSLPESANNYYAQPGGLVDHALNRTEAALGLFQEFMVVEQDAVSEEQKLWQYALYSAALLQGIGKLFIDYRVNLFDINGQLLKQWNPLLESLVNIGTYYNYEFQKDSDADFRRRLNLLLAKALMPPSGFSWIASNQQVLAVWLALLNEDQRSAGTLGAILNRAESVAIQRYLAELLAKSNLSRSGGPFGRAGTFSGGVPESLAEKEQAIGAEFIQWMIQSLEKGLIMINKAPLWMVPGGFIMCAEMFQLFVREHPEYKNWQAIQKAFASLGLHRRAPDGSLLSRFEQTQNQQMLSGIVFSKYAVALPDSVSVYHLNTGKTETMSAIELIHHAQENNHFIQRNNVSVAPLQKLSASGWSPIVPETASLAPGVKNGG
ncbi:TraI domain-containing protein [Legionella sp. km772]|uniref:conjugal transfer nickase/helicase domain-containing protein n=1 Tax=Legionella sp. km772 TaxID=2498111 RepID=UPI0018F680CA|nr:TraI domain-containing protein [Legionella sp. km772]